MQKLNTICWNFPIAHTFRVTLLSVDYLAIARRQFIFSTRRCAIAECKEFSASETLDIPFIYQSFQFTPSRKNYKFDVAHSHFPLD
ncbi:MAG: hypothetical protein V7K50_27575 [Nostoc sp.]|uniref:hypothetical protein n=1 Tax=Nostoc sp. TaxID=1180 RepID=UPI002FF96AEA